MPGNRAQRGRERARRNMLACIHCRLSRYQCERRPGNDKCIGCNDRKLECNESQSAEQSRVLLDDLLRECRVREGQPTVPPYVPPNPQPLLTGPGPLQLPGFGQSDDIDEYLNFDHGIAGHESETVLSSQVNPSNGAPENASEHPLSEQEPASSPFVTFGKLRQNWLCVTAQLEVLARQNLNLSDPYLDLERVKDKTQSCMEESFKQMSEIGFQADSSNDFSRAGETYQRMIDALDILENCRDRWKVLLTIAKYYRRCQDEPEVCRILEKIIHQAPPSADFGGEDPWAMLSSSIEMTTGPESHLVLPEHRESFSPFHRASQYNNPRLSNHFRPSDTAVVPPHDLLGRQALHVAAENGNLDLLRDLLSLEPQLDLDLRDRFGRTPVFLAALCGHDVAFQMLINAGANSEVRNIHSHTVMQVAAQGGHIDIVYRLISLGHSVNEQTMPFHGACPPLHAAAEHGRFEVVQLLVGNGADVSQTDRFSKTSEELARDHGHDKIADFLMKQARDRRTT